jgi:hypothetical protein
VSGIAKGVSGQHILNRILSFLQRHRHNHAFTCGQAVGFDDDRGAFLTQIRESGLNLGEVLVFRTRDLMTRQEILGESFRAFQLRSGLSRTKDSQPGLTEGIHDANYQRRFGADNRQIDLFTPGKLKQGRNISRTNRDILQRRL